MSNPISSSFDLPIQPMPCPDAAASRHRTAPDRSPPGAPLAGRTLIGKAADPTISSLLGKVMHSTRPEAAAFLQPGVAGLSAPVMPPEQRQEGRPIAAAMQLIERRDRTSACPFGCLQYDGPGGAEPRPSSVGDLAPAPVHSTERTKPVSSVHPKTAGVAPSCRQGGGIASRSSELALSPWRRDPWRAFARQDTALWAGDRRRDQLEVGGTIASPNDVPCDGTAVGLGSGTRLARCRLLVGSADGRMTASSTGEPWARYWSSWPIDALFPAGAYGGWNITSRACRSSGDNFLPRRGPKPSYDGRFVGGPADRLPPRVEEKGKQDGPRIRGRRVAARRRACSQLGRTW